MKSHHYAVRLAVLMGGVLPCCAVAEQRSDGPDRLAQSPLQHSEDSAHGLIVRFHDDGLATKQRQRWQDDVLNAALAQVMPSMKTNTSPLPGVQRTLATGAVLVPLPQHVTADQNDQVLELLRADPRVRYAQRDTRQHILAMPPEDPDFQRLQWNLHKAPAGISAPAAWTKATGKGVVVAVLDTGHLPHADLQDNLVPGYDMISSHGQDVHHPDHAADGDGRDPDPIDPGDWVDDSIEWCMKKRGSSWHGAHVAGIVAAVTRNGVGIAGVAPSAKVQPIRVLGRCGGLLSDVIDGVVWAAGGIVDGVQDNRTPADVINMSLGSLNRCVDQPAMQDAIDMALARGTVVVTGAGNETIDAGDFSPGSCRGVINVGATGITGARAYYSNYGPSITLAAPGGDARVPQGASRGVIWSTGDRGQTVANNDHAIIGHSGTSMAAPHVAGVVALMQDAAVSRTGTALTPAQVSDMLRRSVRRFPVQPPQAMSIGAGLIDAARAVAAATGETLPEAGIVLTSGRPLTGQSGMAGSGELYELDVGAGAASIQLRTFGGSGDVSLLVAHGRVPSQEDASHVSQRPGTNEAVLIERPAAGTWYLRVIGVKDYSGVSVLGAVR